MVRRLTHIRANARGFTLVELLVVLAIIAFTAGIVVLNVQPGRSDARIAAEQFAAKLNAAAEYAIMTNSFVGLVLEPGGYEFQEYARGSWHRVDAAPGLSQKTAVSVGFQFDIPEDVKTNEPIDARRDAEEDAQPVVFFTPTGQTTPFTASFSASRKSVRVSLDGAGDVGVMDNE